MSGLSSSLKVGAVLLLALGAFAFGLTLLGGKSFSRGHSYTVTAIFDDGSGLGVRTRVQIAGIIIGVVEGIELDGAAHAKVLLRIDDKFKLYEDANISKRTDSILGDYLLDVRPGTKTLKELKEGGEITNVLRQQGMSEVFASMGKIAGDVGDIVKSLKSVLATDQGRQNLQAVMDGLVHVTQSLEQIMDSSGGKLDDTLTNFRAFSADLRKLTVAEAGDVKAILANTRDTTERANKLLETLNQAVGATQATEVREGIKGVKSSLDKLDKVLANVQSVTDKMNKGEGTVGRLLNDDTLIKNVEKGIGSINQMLGKANDLQVELTARSEFMLGVVNPKLSTLEGIRNTAYNPWAKSYFTVRILPRPDKWYGFELIDDPRGYTQLSKVQNCIGGPSPASCDSAQGGTSTTYFPGTLQQITTTRTLKFSAYIAKRYGLVTARFGILENTGGAGLKFSLLNDDLVLSVDAFEFANPLKEYPRVKLYADYRFLNHLFITAGIDDLVNVPQTAADQPSRIISGRDYFLGGGFFFTEEDFKTLISAVSLLK